MLTHRSDIEDENHGVHVTKNARDTRLQTCGVATASDQQRGHACRLLRHRPVRHAAWRFPEKQVLPVSSNANDLDSLTADDERTADCALAGPEVARERLVDDHHRPSCL